MKKILLFIFLFFNTKVVFGIDTIAEQAILFDLETNSIIFEKNSDELMSPSSMSKIMTLYYVFEKLKKGEITLQDEFKVSKKAWKKGGSRMFLDLNSNVKVEDLIRGIIVQSGNDACITIAEGISGSEEMFVEELNILAKNIGLKDSYFKNSTGWPDPEHLMTAKDLLTLSIKTIENFSEYYHYYTEKEFTYNNIKQLNRNPLIFSSLAADGLKTGHTSLGGYGLVATVVKNNRRLILVLNGLKTNRDRKKEAERLVKLGFNQFKNINIAEANSLIQKIPIWSGNKKMLGIYNNQKINITVPKRIKNDLKFFVKYQSPAIAPISKDSKIAEFLVKKKNGEIIKKFDLFSQEEVKRLGFFGKIFQNLKYLVLGETALK